MKNYYSLILICLLLCPGTITVKGQEVIAASGSSASNTQGSIISWTVGEAFILTAKTRNNILTHGFHQGRLIVTAVNQIDDLPFEVSAYPNPVMDYVNIKTDCQKIGSLTYVLYNLRGKILEQKKLGFGETSVQMTKYEPAIYLLKIIEDGKNIKTFKIVKK